jgi:hypothetical protein
MHMRCLARPVACSYACYLYFQLGTHKDLFSSEEEEGGEQAQLSVGTSLSALAAITITVSFASECVVMWLESCCWVGALGWWWFCCCTVNLHFASDCVQRMGGWIRERVVVLHWARDNAMLHPRLHLDCVAIAY